MIYVTYGAALDYTQPHSESVIARDIAEAFQHAGHSSAVVWAHGATTVAGVPHVGPETEATSEDTLVVVHGYVGAAVARGELFPLLRGAGRRLLYTTAYYTDELADVCGAFFHHVWVESDGFVGQWTQRMQQASWLRLGCTHDVTTAELTDPYPSHPIAFFAGRLRGRRSFQGTASSIDLLRHIARATPSWQFWIASQQFQDLGTSDWGHLPNEQPCEHVRIAAAGATYRALQPDIEHRVVTVEQASRILDMPANVRFLGALPYGTFIAEQHFADAVLDFGFPPTVAVVPHNCKIFDPMRAGARVLAVGHSPSFDLPPAYGGAVVGWADIDAASAMLLEWSSRPESSAERSSRGELFAANHSWRARLSQLLLEVQP